MEETLTECGRINRRAAGESFSKRECFVRTCESTRAEVASRIYSIVMTTRRHGYGLWLAGYRHYVLGRRRS